ncbi:hypothetical protein [Caulobacter sp. Root487D2Y]|jgi:hypothetical protein|nr:hypothetical protein [Caulobacter sp. Root487D2Y]
MRDRLTRRSPEPRLPAINMILADVALWLVLGIAAQLAIRMMR